MSRGQRVVLWDGAIILAFFSLVNFQDAMIAYGGLLRARLESVIALIYLPLAAAFALAYLAMKR